MIHNPCRKSHQAIDISDINFDIKNEHQQTVDSSCLINLEPLEFPIRFREILWVMGNKVRARSRTVICVRIELSLCPQLATEIDVDHDALVLEMRRDVAFCVGEIGERGSPRRWIWDVVGIRHIGWDITAGKEPSSDTCISEFQSVDLSS